MYKLHQNLGYLFGNLWRWDRKIIYAIMVSAPLGIATIFFGIWIPKAIIDAVIQGWQIREGVLGLGALLVAYMVVSASNEALGRWLELGATAHRQRYSVLMTEKAICTDYENMDGPGGREKFSMAMGAVNSNSSVTERFINMASHYGRKQLTLVVFGGMIFTLHPLLVGVVVLGSVLYFIGNRKLVLYTEAHRGEVADKDHKLRYIARVCGDFKGAKDLKLYHVIPWFSQNHQGYLKERMALAAQEDFRRLGLEVLNGIFMVVRDGLAYLFLLDAVLKGTLSIGDFAFYIGAVTFLGQALTEMVSDTGEIMALSLEANHLRGFLDMPDRGPQPWGHGPTGEGQVGLEMENENKNENKIEIEIIDLCYTYPGSEEYAIDHLNLHIKKGEKLAIVGLNGAGKTTLIKLIVGLYTPSQGVIKINGIPTSHYPKEDLYQFFSVVFQDSYVLPLTIEENVTLKRADQLTPKESQRVDAVLKQVGLQRKLDQLPQGKHSRLVKSVYEEAIELSGGENQKLMLAQALYKSGRIMILDEPTAALDPIAENEIYQQYNHLTQDHTSIFISHRLSSTRFCDRIVFIEKGQIVEMGSHEVLMGAGGRYKAMFDMQSHYYKEEVGACV